ncbi:50S ribosomal protein L16 [Fervidicoccus fontis]|uniref:Large ribosomal subunit protein uL16 n=1 Tax=Fervidicoccus fontis TaxID=683846 RepID=A0A843ABE7_9CREN|nr:50S ribosomal protein L16 [Fervidicoccus fontis]MBE9391354.1 50S ribosomal protein L16 [Fervidicoccus fontis]
MPIRPARCYTHFSSPPYTRKEYIPGVPQPKITKFEMGNPKFDADYILSLIVLEDGQIRHNALEAMRVAAHKYLTANVGEGNYYLKVTRYPHHVLRENKMMAFAGADRLQDGMRLSFGKPIGTAVRVYKGYDVLVVKVKKEHLEHAKKALKVCSSKIPFPTMIKIEPAKNN